jgi:hypothetical protein
MGAKCILTGVMKPLLSRLSLLTLISISSNAYGQAEVHNQTLTTDNSIVTRVLGDERYVTLAGANDFAGSLTYNGAQTYNTTSFTYGAGAAEAHRNALGLGVLATVTPEANVAAALAIPPGTSGSVLLQNGTLGNPSAGSISLANISLSGTKAQHDASVSDGSYVWQGGLASVDTLKVTSVAQDNMLVSPTPAMTTGQKNTALGVGAFGESDTGSENTAIGYLAAGKVKGLGGSPLLSGALNTAVGAYSLANATNCVANTTFGQKSGTSITTGSYNTAVGKSCFSNNFTSNNGVYVGASTAEFADHTGQNNVGVGRWALQYLSGSAANNTALGTNSMAATSGAKATGSNNTGIGNDTLKVITTASQNVAAGAQGLGKLTTGGSNVAVGFQALYNTTATASSTAVGNQAGINATGQQNVSVGASSGPNAGAEYNTSLGNFAGNGNTGQYNIFLGYKSNEGAPAATNNSFIVGSDSGIIATMWLGRGMQSATPGAANIRATRGLGTNITGADLTIGGGAGTGTGTGGKLAVVAATSGSSGSTSNPAVRVAEFDGEIIPGQTGLSLRDSTGTLHRVMVGPPDSGGPGQRLLTIPN